MRPDKFMRYTSPRNPSSDGVIILTDWFKGTARVVQAKYDRRTDSKTYTVCEDFEPATVYYRIESKKVNSLTYTLEKDLDFTGEAKQDITEAAVELLTSEGDVLMRDQLYRVIPKGYLVTFTSNPRIF